MPDRERVQSDHRAESAGIQKEEDKLKLDSWIRKVKGIRRNKVKKFSAPGSETASILLKNPEGIRGEEEVGGVEKQPGA